MKFRTILTSLFLSLSIYACGTAEPTGDAASTLVVGDSLEHGLSAPATVNATVTTSDCSNSPGPWVTFDGALVSSGLTLSVIFTNNAKFTHVSRKDTVVDLQVLPPGGSVTLPKQPSHGGVGGNPFIYVQFVDGAGEPLSDELLLGRCVQGTSALDAQLSEALLSSLTLLDAECKNSPGPFVTLEGSVVSGGVSARLIFKNSPKGPHTYAVEGDLEVVPAGTELTIPKQPVLGGAGGNPWVYVEWSDGDGNVLAGPTLVGRCNKL
jgi:hypothetical protein